MIYSDYWVNITRSLVKRDVFWACAPVRKDEVEKKKIQMKIQLLVILTFEISYLNVLTTS